MAAPKRTPSQRENDLGKIASLYLTGKRQIDIANALGLSQMVISRDLAEIHKRWRESALIDINEAKHRELARIDNLEIAYWTAWERSIGPKRKVRKERNAIVIPLDDKNHVRFEIDAEQVKTTVEREELLGNPAYLSGVGWCIEQRCKIFGIYEATKITLDWRKALEEKGHDAGDLFERMVNAYISAVNGTAK